MIDDNRLVGGIHARFNDNRLVGGIQARYNDNRLLGGVHALHACKIRVIPIKNMWSYFLACSPLLFDYTCARSLAGLPDMR